MAKTRGNGKSIERKGIKGVKVRMTAEQIEDALRLAGGIVLRASELLGVSNQTLYNHMKKDPERFKDIREEIEHSMYDLANDGVKAHLEDQNSKVCMWVKGRYESKDVRACFPEGDQSQYMDGGGNTYVQNNININNTNTFNIKINKLCEKADMLGVSSERVKRIRELQGQLEG